MATNLKTFTADLAAESTVVTRELVALHKKQIVAYVDIVAQFMPFDTGHALANIVVSVGAPNPIENFDEPISVAQVVARARAALSGLPPFQVVYVNFNADYTSFLNEGSSTQAPAGFIELAESLVEGAFV